MTNRPHIFFDFDDTISDLADLRIQYVRELSTILSNRYGRTAADWHRALGPALDASIHRYVVKYAGNPENGYLAWICEERGRVARELFEAVGEAITDPESLPALALELQAETFFRGGATYFGGAAGLRGLAGVGYMLSMAS